MAYPHEIALNRAGITKQLPVPRDLVNEALALAQWPLVFVSGTFHDSQKAS